LRYFEEKRRREEADAKIASRLASGSTSDTPVTTRQPQHQQPQRQSEHVFDDAALARKIQVEEQASLRNANEASEKLARQLFEEEEKKRKEREQMELRNTMEDIRQAAKAQADTELARIRQEKAQLEEQVHRAEIEAARGSIELQGVEYPKYWQPQSSNQQLFEVPQRSEEWNWVSGRFKEGLQNQIAKIERNQNKELWMWYWLKRKQMQTKNGLTGANERYVFHGSRNDAYDVILKDGFDHRVAHMGGAIGAGIYFAHSSATSSGYVSGHGHHKKMLFCYVSVGEIGTGAVGLTRPPVKKKNPLSSLFSGNSDAELYDSVGTDGSVYVVFDRTQAYPAYVIYFN